MDMRNRSGMPIGNTASDQHQGRSSKEVNHQVNEYRFILTNYRRRSRHAITRFATFLFLPIKQPQLFRDDISKVDAFTATNAAQIN